MKKLYFSFLTVFAGMSLQAQLTQANHAPAAGDTWTTYQCDSTGITPGTAGTGKTWNFSTIPTRSAIVVNYAAASVSGNTAYSAANVSVSASNNNTWFMNSSAAQLDFYGGSVSMSGIVADLFYTSPAVVADYPMGLNQPTASVTGGSINVSSPLSASGTFTGSSNVEADATGTMVLPGTLGTFTNVTRVMMTQVISFSVSTFIGPVNGTLTQTTYDFYQSGIKAPIFTIASSTATIPSFTTASQTYVTRNKDAVGTTTNVNTTGLSENLVNSVNIYPNPASALVTFNVQNPKAAAVVLYDITGKQISKLMLSEGNARLNVSDFVPGMYIYSITDAKDGVLKTGKLAVSH